MALALVGQACSSPPVNSKSDWRVLATIRTGVGPVAVAIGAGAAWAANSGDGTLARIDTRSNKVTGTIKVGDTRTLQAAGCGCYSVHQCPNGTFRIRRCDVPSAATVAAGSVWVLRNDTRSLLRLDPRDLRVLQEIPIGIEPWDLAGDGRAGIWVVDYFNGRVVHVDPGTGGVVGTIENFPVGPGAVAIGYGSVWITAVNAGELVRIDPATDRIIAEIPVLPGVETYVGPQPLPIAFAGGQVWVRDVKVGMLTRIDPATNTVSGVYEVASFFGRDGVDHLAPIGGTLWLSGLRLQAFDLDKLAVTRTIAHSGTAVSAGADGTLWVTDVTGGISHLSLTG